MRTRAIAAVTAAVALWGCSSSPGRPVPPVITPDPDPTVVRWEPVTEATNDQPLTDISAYIIEASAPGQMTTRRSESPDTRAVTLQLPSGTWTVRVRAVSESLGEGEPAEATKAVR